MKHTLVATMENHPSTFNKVLSLFRCRGFAIDSLAVGHTDVAGIMRLTIVVDGSKTAVEQVVKQLYKIIEVRKVSDVTEDQTVQRELAMIKVSSKPTTRSEIIQLADIYRARVVDVAPNSLIVEVTGTWEKIEAFERMVRPYGLVEMARTGEIAISRGRSET
jgi:acetolactate synthase-1/3 small subunit